ncbi:MAG: hypothetical protein EHM71_15855, partial [Zetaproteobacteria bacterium]
MDTAIGPPLERALRVYLAACRRIRTERDTDGLLDLLRGVPEPEIRLHRFGEHLRSRSAEEAAWTLAYVYERLASGDGRARQVGLHFLDRDRLARVLAPEQLRAVAEVLRRRGHSCAGLFGTHSGPSAPTDDDILPRPKEPVGSRISLARRALAGVVERLLFDPDARVVRTLLGNPRLTEAEVLRLAASRRVAPEALVAVAQDDRWIARYAVKVALANNPATPSRIVLGLLPHLMRQDLEEVSASASRNEVRARAAS